MNRHADSVVQPVGPDTAGPTMHHVMVVGGTLAEWAEMPPGDWEKRVDELGRYCASIGVPWLTVMVYQLGTGDGHGDVPRAWRHDVEGCSVAVDPCGDGRRRFADAMNRIEPDAEVTESAVAAALFGPAEAEPDLLVILGPSTQLPPSLVWELAYAELVFLPVAWADFDSADLAAAVVDFSTRRRRFGGLDDE